MEAQDKEAIKKVLISYLKASLIVIGSIGLAYFLKGYIDLSKCKYIMVISLAVPTIGTVGFLTWDTSINTWGGESIPEKLNTLILYITYIVGIVLSILGTA